MCLVVAWLHNISNDDEQKRKDLPVKNIVLLNINVMVGDKTVQCGRKVDALKLWMLWRALGDAGMAAITDNCFRNAQ